MATTINADTSNGLVLTPDTSGDINLQSAGVTKASITSAGFTVGGSNISPQPTFRNRIINGNMAIDQRNAGAAVTAHASYPVDRWYISNSANGTFSAQQVSDTPVGFSSSLKITITAAQTANTGNLSPVQVIEGNNLADLAWGTADAKTVTISFWVRSSLTGTFGGALRNSAANRSYPFSYTISVANTWEYKTITIAGDTSGTWLTTNGIGISVRFSLYAVASSLQAAGAWYNGSATGATGQTQLASTNGATFYITGVQLEVGEQASDFENLQYGQQLALCQRYYETGSAKLGAYTHLGANFPIGMLTGTGFKVTKRTTPDVSITTTSSSNIYTNSGNTANINVSSFSQVGLVTTQNNFGSIVISWTGGAEL